MTGGGRISRGAILLQSGGLVALGIAWGLSGTAPLAWAAAGLLVAELATLSALSGVRTVAIQTFRQCIRTKIAATFMILLAVLLAVMPLVMQGDDTFVGEEGKGTLAGKIRTLLSWGTGTTAVLLGLVTVLLAASLVSSDVRDRTILITATKPLPRWQYVVGRWAGVVLVDAALLAAAGGAIYAYALALGEGKALNVWDRLAVETEVFAARDKVAPNPTGVQRRFDNRIAAMKADGRWKTSFDSYLVLAKGHRDQATRKLLEAVMRQVTEQDQSRGHGGQFLYEFEGVHPSQAALDRTGTILEPLRPARAPLGPWKQWGWLRVRVARAVAARMIPGAPIDVDGVEGMILDGRGDDYAVGFRQEDLGRRSLANLEGGQTVRLTLVPIVQLTYKPLIVAGDGPRPGDRFLARWFLGSPSTGRAGPIRRKDAVGIAATLTFPARIVGADGKLTAECWNDTPASVKIDSQDVFLLFPRGTFGWNYLRAMLLILCQLAFLAAAGVLAGAFLSFPVATLVCLAMLPFSLMRGFLQDALKLPEGTHASVDAVTWIGHYAAEAMNVLLPDFAQAGPGTALIDGMYLPWTHVAATAAVAVGVRALCVLALGCVIFRRRELARVQI